MTYPDIQPNTHASRDVSRSSGQINPVTGGKRPFVPKGHDAQLHEAQNNRLQVTLTLLNGESYDGTIAKRDKFTITLAHQEDGAREIFYKHAIQGVLIHPLITQQ